MMREKKVVMRLINNQCYISLINNRTLQRICALNNLHLVKSDTRGLNSYYVNVEDLPKFITVFTGKEYSVEFI